jgi:enolase
MTRFAVADVVAWEALDSRGSPTVACAVSLDGGASGEAIVPSGASKGSHEARELRDGGARYGGLGVEQAVTHVNAQLRSAVLGRDARDQHSIDDALTDADGTASLYNLGANAVLAVSIAVARAAADGAGAPLYRSVSDAMDGLLPMPMVNIISGGAHAGWMVDVQDFLAVPVGAATFAQSLEWVWRVRHGTAAAMRERGFETALVADEGGLAAPLPSNHDALDLIVDGIRRADLEPGRDVAVAIDLAATQLANAEGYRFGDTHDRHQAAEVVEEIARWCARYPIVSVEDPLSEDDWDGWTTASSALSNVQLVGDDLFATNELRLRRAVDTGVANAILVKPNQIGTLSGAQHVLEAARAAGYATVLSARSGDTEDSWLADLAVGWRSGQIKVGSTTRSERTAKWNRLLRIEQELGDRAVFAGRGALAPLG